MLNQMLNQNGNFELIIKEKHLDTFGHVNNAAYMQIFEEARWEMITKNGWGLEKIRQTGLGPVMLDAHLRFQKELLLRHRIVIETRTVSYKGKIGTMVQKMINENNEVCCSAEYKFGLFDTHARRLLAPTPEWLQAIDFSPT